MTIRSILLHRAQWDIGKPSEELCQKGERNRCGGSRGSVSVRVGLGQNRNRRPTLGFRAARYRKRERGGGQLLGEGGRKGGGRTRRRRCCSHQETSSSIQGETERRAKTISGSDPDRQKLTTKGKLKGTDGMGVLTKTKTPRKSHH